MWISITSLEPGDENKPIIFDVSAGCVSRCDKKTPAVRIPIHSQEMSA